MELKDIPSASWESFCPMLEACTDIAKCISVPSARLCGHEVPNRLQGCMVFVRHCATYYEHHGLPEVQSRPI